MFIALFIAMSCFVVLSPTYKVNTLKSSVMLDKDERFVAVFYSAQDLYFYFEYFVFELRSLDAVFVKKTLGGYL